MLKTWKDKFIPSKIIDSIVHYNANQYKREGYTTELNIGNFENDLDTTIADTSIEKNHMYSGYIYININNQW